MLRRFVIQARIDYGCSTSIAELTPVTSIFSCWIRYVMEEVRRNLSWKRQPYLFWFGLIPAKRKQTMGMLKKMPPFRRVRLLTRDEHAHSFYRWVAFSTKHLHVFAFSSLASRLCFALSSESAFRHSTQGYFSLKVQIVFYSLCITNRSTFSIFSLYKGALETSYRNE